MQGNEIITFLFIYLTTVFISYNLSDLKNSYEIAANFFASLI